MSHNARTLSKHHDLGHSPLRLPPGVSHQLAAHIIEEWFNSEHVEVLQTLLTHRSHGAQPSCITIRACPPGRNSGWRFEYRGVDYHAGEFMPLTDQLDRLKGLSETDGGLGGWAEGRPGGEASEPDPHDGLTEGAPDGLPE